MKRHQSEHYGRFIGTTALTSCISWENGGPWCVVYDKMRLLIELWNNSPYMMIVIVSISVGVGFRHEIPARINPPFGARCTVLCRCQFNDTQPSGCCCWSDTRSRRLCRRLDFTIGWFGFSEKIDICGSGRQQQKPLVCLLLLPVINVLAVRSIDGCEMINRS